MNNVTTKVFLVLEDDRTWTTAANGDLYGVFSTRARAEAWVAAHPTIADPFGFQIVEYVLDHVDA
jgi:hypothetical protein